MKFHASAFQEKLQMRIIGLILAALFVDPSSSSWRTDVSPDGAWDARPEEAKNKILRSRFYGLANTAPPNSPLYGAMAIILRCLTASDGYTKLRIAKVIEGADGEAKLDVVLKAALTVPECKEVVEKHFFPYGVIPTLS
jgi:hypothetical protein